MPISVECKKTEDQSRYTEDRKRDFKIDLLVVVVNFSIEIVTKIVLVL